MGHNAVSEQRKRVKTMPGENTEHQSMLDSIENPVIALNQELKVSYCNPAYARAAGLKIGEMLGRYCWKSFRRRQEMIAIGLTWKYWKRVSPALLWV